MDPGTQEKPCDVRGRDRSSGAASQGGTRIADNHQKLGRGKEGFYAVLEGVWPYQHLDLRVIASRIVRQ